jgi:protein-disulfide isomerase
VPLLGQVLECYPKEVKVVYKNFPLSMHQFAAPAAVAAMAAHKQGKFWPYHDKLFTNSGSLSEKKFEEIAAEVGLNKAQFEADRKDPALHALVNRDLQDGLKAEVRGVPCVFINGRLLKDRSLQGFRDLIGKQLQKAAQPSQ